MHGHILDSVLKFCLLPLTARQVMLSTRIISPNKNFPHNLISFYIMLFHIGAGTERIWCIEVVIVDLSILHQFDLSYMNLFLLFHKIGLYSSNSFIMDVIDGLNCMDCGNRFKCNLLWFQLQRCKIRFCFPDYRRCGLQIPMLKHWLCGKLNNWLRLS